MNSILSLMPMGLTEDQSKEFVNQKNSKHEERIAELSKPPPYALAVSVSAPAPIVALPSAPVVVDRIPQATGTKSELRANSIFPSGVDREMQELEAAAIALNAPEPPNAEKSCHVIIVQGQVEKRAVFS